MNLQTFQQEISQWLLICFTREIADDIDQRNHRFLEEALELVQSCGCSITDAHTLVNYVYGRPVGEKDNEVGGVMVTLAALCYANRLELHDASIKELKRICQDDVIINIQHKQKSKPALSPLPGTYPGEVEIKIDTSTIPQNGQQVEFRKVGEYDWIKGEYDSEQQLFCFNDGDFAFIWHVEKWRPIKI